MTIESFVYQGSPQRVIFGSGTLDRLPDELTQLGIERALILSTPAQVPLVQRVAGRIRERCGATFTDARVHTPIDITQAAMAVVEREHIDGLLALGGGSTIGLSKAIALRTDLPQLVAPTTYAGSEMTNILGQTEGGKKTTQRDPRVLPEVVLYDIDLTLTLSPRVSVASAMNAIAHAVEALYAADRNPVSSLLAEEGIRALGLCVTEVARRPANKEARAKAMYGAWLCGSVLNGTSMGLHHQLCHVLGGRFDLRHAETHAAVLPHVAAYNAHDAVGAMTTVANALGAPYAPGALYDLAKFNGAPVALREIGMPEAGLDEIADIVAACPNDNPRPVVRDALRQVLDDAWYGRRPGLLSAPARS